MNENASPAFAEYVKKQEEDFNITVDNPEDRSIVTGLKNQHNFNLPNGDYTDIGHMFGTMDITYHNNSLIQINHCCKQNRKTYFGYRL